MVKLISNSRAPDIDGFNGNSQQSPCMSNSLELHMGPVTILILIKCLCSSSNLAVADLLTLRQHLIGLIWYSEPLITTFVKTAKFVIKFSTKIRGSCFFSSLFHCYSHVILQENIRFVCLLESPRRGDSNKYMKRMIHKKLFKICVIDALDGFISSFFTKANLI